MRKVLLLAVLSMIAVPTFASAAFAQSAGPGGEGPCTGTPFEQYLPAVNGCVTTEGLPNPGEAIVYDADTREPIGTLAEVTGSSPTATPTTSPTASATATASATPSATASASGAAALQYVAPSLPETGGTSPLAPIVALALLVGGGLLATLTVHRG